MLEEIRANASDLEDLDFDDEDEDDDSLSGHRRRNTDSKYVVFFLFQIFNRNLPK